MRRFFFGLVYIVKNIFLNRIPSLQYDLGFFANVPFGT